MYEILSQMDGLLKNKKNQLNKQNDKIARLDADKAMLQEQKKSFYLRKTKGTRRM